MSSSRGACARPLMSLGSGGPTVGRAAANKWLSQRGAGTPTTLRWYVEIALGVHDAPAPVEYDDKSASRFHISIYSEEWGVFFCHGGRASWIRITDIAFVHGRDEHGLLSLVPSLDRVGDLLRRIEALHQIRFRRDHALIRTNLPAIEPKVRAWTVSL